MKQSAPIILLLLAFSLTLPGCTDSKIESKPVSTATPTAVSTASAAATPSAATVDAKRAFPETLGDYEFKGWKTKKHDWGTSYSATYKSSTKDKLKVIINDAPPAGREAWLPFFATGKTFRNKPMALDAKPGKLTMMVRVGTRFRVDFKTRTGHAAQLRAAADRFDFAKVHELGQ